MKKVIIGLVIAVAGICLIIAAIALRWHNEAILATRICTLMNSHNHLVKYGTEATRLRMEIDILGNMRDQEELIANPYRISRPPESFTKTDDSPIENDYSTRLIDRKERFHEAIGITNKDAMAQLMFNYSELLKQQKESTQSGRRD